MYFQVIPVILATFVAVNAFHPNYFVSKITDRVDALDTCKMCVDVSGQIINQVLNIILSKWALNFMYAPAADPANPLRERGGGGQ